MRWSQACKYKLPFGKFKGETIEDIGATYDGLEYLVWLNGKRLKIDTKVAVQTYLDAPIVAAVVSEIEAGSCREIDDPYGY